MFKKRLKKLLIFCLILWIGGYSAFIINIFLKAPMPLEKPTDALIILTGGQHRIQTGLSLWQAGLSDTLFITGVHPSVTKKNILSMWKQNSALPDCCLILGHEATTTLENAREVRGWIAGKDIKSIRLVTSAYHMDRALLEFRRVMQAIEITPHPVSHESDITNMHFWHLTFTEYHKILLRSITFLVLDRVV